MSAKPEVCWNCGSKLFRKVSSQNGVDWVWVCEACGATQ